MADIEDQEDLENLDYENEMALKEFISVALPRYPVPRFVLNADAFLDDSKLAKKQKELRSTKADDPDNFYRSFRLSLVGRNSELLRLVAALKSDVPQLVIISQVHFVTTASYSSGSNAC